MEKFQRLANDWSSQISRREHLFVFTNKFGTHSLVHHGCIERMKWNKASNRFIFISHECVEGRPRPTSTAKFTHTHKHTHNVGVCSPLACSLHAYYIFTIFQIINGKLRVFFTAFRTHYPWFSTWMMYILFLLMSTHTVCFVDWIVLRRSQNRNINFVSLLFRHIHSNTLERSHAQFLDFLWKKYTRKSREMKN